MSETPQLITFSFRTSHERGGQHTNGPDYGVVIGQCELTGVRVEIQTDPLLPSHKARNLIKALIELANQEIAP